MTSFAILLTLALALQATAQSKATEPAAADTKSAADDTTSTAADAESVPADSTAQAAEAKVDSTYVSDPAFEWKRWKDLARAIRLRPLDGPSDILEKAEIVEDRIDDLTEERGRLVDQARDWKIRREALETQLEVLDDLARVQRGGDLQLQQRMHNMREGRRLASRRQVILEASLQQMDSEVERLNELSAEYKSKAEDLRRRERESR